MALNILAFGANGTQMAAGTQALVEAGHCVRAFTRSFAGANRWKAAGVDVAFGNMSNAEALRRACEGQDALFLHVPLISDLNDNRCAWGLNALKAAKTAGVERVVWNTGGPIIDPSSQTETGAVILRALQDGGFSFLGLTPVTYMENLLGPWTLAALTQGELSYPTPSAFKMQWGAAADFGRVADKALQSGLTNEVLPLGGPTALDGDDLARIMSNVLGRKLIFKTMPATEFERQLSDVAGPNVAAMIAGMYSDIQVNPAQFQQNFVTEAKALEEQFDIKLTPFAEWVSLHRSHFIQ